MADAMTDLVLNVDAILAGKPAFIAPGMLSAMGKLPVAGSVRITWLGIEGDAVADPTVHGGHDKAIHLFPQEHYHWWRMPLGKHPLLEAPGAFGENLATRGAIEGMLCLGDRFTLGTALLEICQGRQPCSKLNHRFGNDEVLARAVQTGRIGLYLRVIREGDARGGDAMTLTERPHPDWSVARMFDLLVAGGYRRDPAGVAELARLSVLAEAWRSRAEKLAR
jgi:MOSC domain-containing protein YiiM